MQYHDLLPLFVELTKKHPDLVFWKHFERGISGQGDIDTIAPFSEVDKIGADFIHLVFEHFPEAKGVVDCRHSTNVRPHFFVFESEYPKLFQFDISWQPTRLSLPWCNPASLSMFSIINDYGVRILTPGALSIVLIMLYGINPNGTNRMKQHDWKDVQNGVFLDSKSAHAFIDLQISYSLRADLHKLILNLENGMWSSICVRRIWRNILFQSIKMHLSQGTRHCLLVAANLYKSEWLGQQKEHHHARHAEQATWSEYLNNMSSDLHVISYAAPRSSDTDSLQ